VSRWGRSRIFQHKSKTFWQIIFAFPRQVRLFEHD